MTKTITEEVEVCGTETREVWKTYKVTVEVEDKETVDEYGETLVAEAEELMQADWMEEKLNDELEKADPDFDCNGEF